MEGMTHIERYHAMKERDISNGYYMERIQAMSLDEGEEHGMFESWLDEDEDRTAEEKYNKALVIAIVVSMFVHYLQEEESQRDSPKNSMPFVNSWEDEFNCGSSVPLNYDLVFEYGAEAIDTCYDPIGLIPGDGVPGIPKSFYRKVFDDLVAEMGEKYPTGPITKPTKRKRIKEKDRDGENEGREKKSKKEYD